jgi:hypothetical protein
MLNDIIKEIREFDGIKRKQDITIIKKIFKDVIPIFGDDGGVIRLNNEYIIFSTDSIIPSILNKTPYWGGYSSIIVNVNDIYAMGGIPMGIVNVISCSDIDKTEEIAKGIRDGSKKYRVPILGGHISRDHDTPFLSLAIIGKSKSILRSFDLKSSDLLILAIDINGERYHNYLHWNSTFIENSEEILDKLKILNIIAENNLASGVKDISIGGILGTISILLELSNKGAYIDIESIPYPEGFDFIDWLKIFPSYGFILGSSKINAYKIIDLFNKKGISSNIIGNVNESKRVILRYKGKEGILFDFYKERII